MLNEADLVISVGARLGLRQIGHMKELFASKAKLIRCDDLKVRLGGEFRLHDNLSLYGETMDVRGNKANTYMGVRTYF